MTHGTVALISGLFDLSGGIFVFIKMIYDSSLGVRLVFKRKITYLFELSENQLKSYADFHCLCNLYIFVLDKKYNIYTNGGS